MGQAHGLRWENTRAISDPYDRGAIHRTLGKHEPLIYIETFNEIQDRLKG
ncbi:MAG: hypothetical protein OHK0018_00030 [Erythrobacter tepidarius]